MQFSENSLSSVSGGKIHEKSVMDHLPVRLSIWDVDGGPCRGWRKYKTVVIGGEIARFKVQIIHVSRRLRKAHPQFLVGTLIIQQRAAAVNNALVAATAVVVAVRAARWIGNQSARSGASPSARGLMRVYLNTRIAARAGDAKESGEIYEDSHGRRNVALSCSPASSGERAEGRRRLFHSEIGGRCDRRLAAHNRAVSSSLGDRRRPRLWSGDLEP